MENLSGTPDGMVNNHSLKKFGEKIATNLHHVNIAMKDFSLESRVNTRLGVSIDWSKGTMNLQANR
jgi:hypothetical protein